MTKGPYIPTTMVGGETITKTKDQYIQEDFARLLKNCKGMHILYCG